MAKRETIDTSGGAAAATGVVMGGAWRVGLAGSSGIFKLLPA
jgi:hypothetical protein